MRNQQIKKVPEHFFEIYKISVEMADKISARRVTANTFFLTLTSALILLIDKVDDIIVSLLGIIISISWWLLLKSYRELNSAKYKVIQKMEEELPAKPFTDEWELLKEDPVKGWRKRYAELGQVEKLAPLLLGVFYLYLLFRKVDFSGIVKLLCHNSGTVQ